MIPANQWSDKDLPEHLKMRISIRDTKGRELKALRNNIILDEFPISNSIWKLQTINGDITVVKPE